MSTTGGRSSGGGNKKESMTELAKMIDATVRVKCLGGRELKGVLKGYDDLINLVLDECDEILRDPNDLDKLTDKTRKLGLIVIRGTQVSLVSPEDGMEEIANPFTADDDEDDVEE